MSVSGSGFEFIAPYKSIRPTDDVDIRIDDGGRVSRVAGQYLAPSERKQNDEQVIDTLSKTIRLLQGEKLKGKDVEAAKRVFKQIDKGVKGDEAKKHLVADAMANLITSLRMRDQMMVVRGEVSDDEIIKRLLEANEGKILLRQHLRKEMDGEASLPVLMRTLKERISTPPSASIGADTERYLDRGQVVILARNGHGDESQDFNVVEEAAVGTIVPEGESGEILTFEKQLDAILGEAALRLKLPHGEKKVLLKLWEEYKTPDEDKKTPGKRKAQTKEHLREKYQALYEHLRSGQIEGIAASRQKQIAALTLLVVDQKLITEVLRTVMEVSRVAFSTKLVQNHNDTRFETRFHRRGEGADTFRQTVTTSLVKLATETQGTYENLRNVPVDVQIVMHGVVEGDVTHPEHLQYHYEIEFQVPKEGGDHGYTEDMMRALRLAGFDVRRTVLENSTISYLH